jgi:hypothetical protein
MVEGCGIQSEEDWGIRWIRNTRKENEETGRRET